MIILIDIGNTSTKIAASENSRVMNVTHVDTLKGIRTADEFSGFLTEFMKENKLPGPEGSVICSVIPEKTELLKVVVQNSFRISPVTVDTTIKTGLRFSVRNPETLGADRIANAVAAWKLYEGHTIVVDIGTATTVCLITSDGEYRGGAIMPGMGIAASALSEKTSKLPDVELMSPEKILDNDTAANIRTGVILGHAGAVEKVIAEIQREFGKTASVIATGGYTDLIRPFMKFDHVNSLLTFEGMNFIYELNS